MPKTPTPPAGLRGHRHASVPGDVPRSQYTLTGYRQPTGWDHLLARAADRLRPHCLTEDGWRRRTHSDVPSLEDWELRRELRILGSYLDTPFAQHDWHFPWFTSRREALLAELKRRRSEAAQRTSRQPVAHARGGTTSTPSTPAAGRRADTLRPTIGGAP